MGQKGVTILQLVVERADLEAIGGGGDIMRQGITKNVPIGEREIGA